MINIREGNSNDLQLIVGFQQKMALETENLILDHDKVKKGVGAVLSDKSKGFYIIGTYGSVVVSSLLLTPEWSDWRNGYFLWIQSLYVIPDFRKKGVFSMMYNFVKNKVNASNGFVGIKLYVDKNNEIAQNAYEKVGMESSHYRLFEWLKH